MNEFEIIHEIRNLREEQIPSWIENRRSELEGEENSELLNDFKINNKNLETNFLARTSTINKDEYEALPFILDDIEPYKQLVSDIRNSDNELIENNNYIIHMIQCLIINYFGLHGIEESRSELFKSYKIDNEPISITLFKKNLSAMSVERSAMAHNLLRFLGYNSILNYGCTSSNSSQDSQLHAFNCIINNGRALIVDFTNPSYIDGKYYVPSCFVIGEEQVQGFFDGEFQIEVQHKDYYTKNGEVQEYKTVMKYESNPIMQTEEPKDMSSASVEEKSMTLVQKTKWYKRIVEFFKRILKKQNKEVCN